MIETLKETLLRLFDKSNSLADKKDDLQEKRIGHEYEFSVDSYEKDLFLESINNEKSRIEKDVGYELKFMDLVSDDIHMDVYFNDNEISFFNIRIYGWDSYIPSNVVKRLLEKYYSGNSCSLSLLDDRWNVIFNLWIHNVDDHFEVEYKGKYKMQSAYKNTIKEILEILGISYEENEDKIKIKEHQDNVDITSDNIIRLYERIVSSNNKIHVYIPGLNNNVSIFNDLIYFSYVEPDELDGIEEFLNDYEKSLYKQEYKITFFNPEPEEKPEENTIKFV